ncbi:MAG: glycosyltransferase [candidate division Zixibacteria bacterium]|nr:glycosyltransferase [Candidatus Tariuqbacter arcticus]
MNDGQNIRYSAVIPSYNAAGVVWKTIEALLAQEGAEGLEIIVVDDGSTDDTSEVVRRYPVQYIHKTNGGPASARNLGAPAAEGGIILFLDSDCVPQAGWLKAMTAPFADEEISGVKGVYITRQRSLVARFVQLEFEERYRMLERQEYIDFVDSYSAAFKKDAFFAVGGFDGSFPKADNEDVDLSYKLAKGGYKMVYQPEAVVEHTHPASLMKYLRVKFSRGYWRMAVYKMHPEKAVKDSYTPQTLKLQIIAAGLFWLGIIWWITAGFWYFVVGITVLFLLLTLPFMMGVFRLDPGAAVLTPAMLFLRANCFLAGVGVGVLRHFFRR